MNIDEYDYFYDYEFDFDEIDYKAALENEPANHWSFIESDNNQIDEIISEVEEYKYHHEDDFIRDHYHI